MQAAVDRVADALHFREQVVELAGDQLKLDLADRFALLAGDDGAVVQRYVDPGAVGCQVTGLAADLDVEYRLQVDGGELAEVPRQRRVDDQRRVGDRIGNEHFPFPAGGRIGVAVSHRDGLRDGAAVGMGVQADVAVAQLPVAGIEVDAMERLPLRRLELAPPARAPHLGERVGVGSQLQLDFAICAHRPRFTPADLLRTAA